MTGFEPQTREGECPPVLPFSRPGLGRMMLRGPLRQGPSLRRRFLGNARLLTPAVKFFRIQLAVGATPAFRWLSKSAVAECWDTVVRLAGPDEDHLPVDPRSGTRAYGDAWLWARRTSTADVTPLVAATNALHAAVGSPEDTEIHIW
jgi:hypothetical protein